MRQNTVAIYLLVALYDGGKICELLGASTLNLFHPIHETAGGITAIYLIIINENHFHLTHQVGYYKR